MSAADIEKKLDCLTLNEAGNEGNAEKNSINTLPHDTEESDGKASHDSESEKKDDETKKEELAEFSSLDDVSDMLEIRGLSRGDVKRDTLLNVLLHINFHPTNWLKEFKGRVCLRFSPTDDHILVLIDNASVRAIAQCVKTESKSDSVEFCTTPCDQCTNLTQKSPSGRTPKSTPSSKLGTPAARRLRINGGAAFRLLSPSMKRNEQKK